MVPEACCNGATNIPISDGYTIKGNDATLEVSGLPASFAAIYLYAPNPIDTGQVCTGLDPHVDCQYPYEQHCIYNCIVMEPGCHKLFTITVADGTKFTPQHNLHAGRV